MDEIKNERLEARSWVKEEEWTVVCVCDCICVGGDERASGLVGGEK